MGRGGERGTVRGGKGLSEGGHGQKRAKAGLRVGTRQKGGGKR